MEAFWEHMLQLICLSVMGKIFISTKINVIVSGSKKHKNKCSYFFIATHCCVDSFERGEILGYAVQGLLCIKITLCY